MCLGGFIFKHKNTKAQRKIKRDMSNGYIYILTNPSIRGVKIGFTTRATKKRAMELSKPTGVPGRYSVAYEKYVNNCKKVEKLIHKNLLKYRTDRKFHSSQF